MNDYKSTIDHIIISNNLLNSVNHSDVRDDVDNHSDNLPINGGAQSTELVSLYIGYWTLNNYYYYYYYFVHIYLCISIAKIAASNVRQYLLKPKCFCVDRKFYKNINMNSTSNWYACC